MRILPDMHQIEGSKADWELVPPAEWNVYQQRAAASHGIDTPGNRETAKGAILTAAGIVSVDHDQYLLGLILGTWGRYKDIKDGTKAEESSTKGPIGEAFDAATDYALLAAALPVLQRKELVSKAEAIFLEATLGSKLISTADGLLHHRKEHVVRAGKLGAFTLWLGIGGRVITRIADRADVEPATTEKMSIASNAVFRTGLALTGRATVGYMKPTLDYYLKSWRR